MAFYNDFSSDYADSDACYPSHFDLYHKLGEYLTQEEVKLLTYLLRNVLRPDVAGRISCGRDLFLALEESNIFDEELLRRIVVLLKTIRRHDVLPQIHVRHKRKAAIDPLEEYLLRTTDSTTDAIPEKRRKEDDCASDGPETSDAKSSPHKVWISLKRKAPKKKKKVDSSSSSTEMWEIAPKLTCDVRLRVRADFCSHERALEGNLSSNKPDPLERKFELLNQAVTILKSRDLGYIVCDIKFSEITYLDAFWRDYLNGTLLEALKVC